MRGLKPAIISNNPFYNGIWNRVFRKDQNEILLIVGGTGTCKSGTALRIGNDLDLDYKGNTKILYKKDIKFNYRKSSLEKYIILSCTIRLSKGKKEEINSSHFVLLFGLDRR